MKLLNYTPHTLNIHTDDGVMELAPSGEVARVSVQMGAAETLSFNGYIVPTFVPTYGEVTGLPDPVEGVGYIVSGLVASAAKRDDVFSPGELVRDNGGKPIGCKGLKRA